MTQHSCFFKSLRGYRGEPWYTGDTADEEFFGEFGELLAHAYAYTGPEGRLGISCHMLILLPRNTIVTAHRSGQTDGEPDVVYYRFDGHRLLWATEEEWADWGFEDYAIFHE